MALHFLALLLKCSVLFSSISLSSFPRGLARSRFRPRGPIACPRPDAHFSHQFCLEREPSGLEAGPSSSDSGHSLAQRQQKPRKKPAPFGKVKAACVPAPAALGVRGLPQSPWEIDVSVPSRVRGPEFVNVTRNPPQLSDASGSHLPVPVRVIKSALGAFGLIFLPHPRVRPSGEPKLGELSGSSPLPD